MEHHKSGRYREAEALYRAHLETAPDHAAGHVNLANVLKRMGRIDDAIAGYKRAIDLVPTQPLFWQLLGDALDSAGMTSKALEAYREALTHEAANKEALKGLARISSQTGDHAQEATAYAELRDLDPENTDAAFGYALALRKLGAREEARAVYESLIARQPSDVHAYVALGEWYQEGGDGEMAEAAFRTGAGVLYFSGAMVGSGFNEQDHRKQMFQDIVDVIAPEALIETGTCSGTTTRYMRDHADAPIYTCEVNQSLCRLAEMRLRAASNITVFNLESQAFLSHLATEGAVRLDVPTFFYLDAHWFYGGGQDYELPLAQEVRFIFANWAHPVILIDDFSVPDDGGYSHDGLHLGMFREVLQAGGVQVFFPSLPSERETGYKRGSVVLCRTDETAEKLAACNSLRPWPPRTN
jgi:tetratricopeptide (TPR) repeat protein